MDSIASGSIGRQERKSQTPCERQFWLLGCLLISVRSGADGQEGDNTQNREGFSNSQQQILGSAGSIPVAETMRMSLQRWAGRRYLKSS